MSRLNLEEENHFASRVAIKVDNMTSCFVLTKMGAVLLD